jgi:hypothetical protein
MFNYDWFHGEAFRYQMDDATLRCAISHFPDLPEDEYDTDDDFLRFRSELEVRKLIYLRDGFSYEIKHFADVPSHSHLTFECEPVDDHYKVGAFVVTVPFEEIVRIEVYAVHPSEKPDDLPQITGFRNMPEQGHPQ